MGRFNASLRLPGDSQGVSAVVELTDGRLRLASGDHLIGEWELAKVDLVGGPEGVRLSAEGETILLDIQDRSVFEAEAAQARSRKGQKRARRMKDPQAVAPSSAPDEIKKRAHGSRFDRFLAAAHKRLGSILPDWVFTKGGVVVVAAATAVTVVFAGVVSNLLLITGVVVLLVGGVCMLDGVIAARVLRHKVTPTQTLIAGGAVFVSGLLIGLFA